MRAPRYTRKSLHPRLRARPSRTVDAVEMSKDIKRRRKKRSEKKNADEAVVRPSDGTRAPTDAPRTSSRAKPEPRPRVDVQIARWKKKSFFGLVMRTGSAYSQTASSVVVIATRSTRKGSETGEQRGRRSASGPGERSSFALAMRKNDANERADASVVVFPRRFQAQPHRGAGSKRAPPADQYKRVSLCGPKNADGADGEPRAAA